MLVELGKQDLISLVRGREPSYEQMGHPLCESQGRYNASYGTWDWNYSAFLTCSEQEIWDFYQYLKTPIPEKIDLRYQEVVNEIWSSYYLAKSKGNIFIQTACQEELMRMGEWK